MRRFNIFSACAVLLLLAATRIAAHDIARDVTVQAFLKPDGQRLHFLVRVPLAAIRDIDYPKREDGTLDLSRAERALNDAATQWIADEVALFEDDRRLDYPRVVAVRAAVAADTSFGAYEQAFAHVTGAALPDNTEFVWNQGWLDVLFEYAIRSDRAKLSIDPRFARLGIRVVTVLRFLPPGGAIRAFEYTGDPGLVRLDPRWHQAAWRFVQLGFAHILDGIDHLLFLFCLVIPFRRIRSLIIVVTSFTVAHSITLIASAYDLGPTALWFPTLIEMLIAVSIVYMAMENIVGASLHRRWIITFVFGLVHGFGFSFGLRQTLQFAGSHLLTSLLSFNIGVELGQVVVLAMFVPALSLLFRYVVAERIGTIILSALVAHTGWHWTTERFDALRQFTFEWPEVNTNFWLTTVRWLLVIVMGAAIAWAVSVAAKHWRRGHAKPEGGHVTTGARTLIPILALCAALTATAAGAQQLVTGIVVDASGAPVAGATVATDGQAAVETKTGDDGRFTVSGVARDRQLRVTAPGFAMTTIHLSEARADQPLRIVLAPASLAESVTVTASRGLTALETPSATTVLTNAELVNSAAGAVDDALRNTPGFTLFRRSSSRVANPTTQGVTLRGVSGSGASRTLVLADGLPLNDPFGSWVYWNRIPQAAIDRIEVVRGATGDLYGADALGGVIQVLTFTPTRLRVRGIADVGSKDTTRVSVFGGGGARGWTVAASGEALKTQGIFILADRDRGVVDRRADSDYRTGFVSAGYSSGLWRTLVRASGYSEDRGNGTAVQINNTDWRQVSGEATGPALRGVWLARAAGGTQDYFQTFSAVAVDRRTERLTTEQQTPSTFSTYIGQWARAWRRVVVLAGAEGKRIKTTGSEFRYSTTNERSGPFPFGGTETDTSAFGRVSLAPSANVAIVAGARVDGWKSDPLSPQLPVHSVTFFSPRASASWRRGDVALQASAYRAHRTPTLNELHRGFRAGNVNTNPNPLLEPEVLTGVDGGVLLSRGRMSVRATTFWNRLDDAIANISLNATTRERQNADTVHVGGVEFEADARAARNLTVSGLAVFTSSHFRHEVKQPQLEGKRVPQVPSYQFGAGVAYTPAAFTFTAHARSVSSQFEDDLNTLKLDRYTVVDFSAGRTITRMLTAFVAVENLFDAEYAVGKTPVLTTPPSTLTTIGWPRTVRAGVRVFLP